MKKIFSIVAVAMMLLASCEDVSEKNRFINMAGEPVSKKVLVEEFTGQMCPNCPDGHEVLHGIKSVYGDNVVVVSIHSGALADGEIEFGGLKTPEGDTYADMWSFDSYPKGVVNRASGIQEVSALQGYVFQQFKESAESPVEISINAHVVGGEIVIESELKGVNEELAGKFQLWITEDKVIAYQEATADFIAKYAEEHPGADIADPYIVDYEHNHVYRASVNGVGGENVVASKDGITLTHRIAISEYWNVDNLNVVGFMYNGKVIQAEEVKVE